MGVPGGSRRDHPLRIGRATQLARRECHLGHVAADPLATTTYLATRHADHGKTVSTYLSEMFIGAHAEPRRYVLSDTELARIYQRVLIIWGQHDGALQSIEEARSRAALMPNARFEVVPGGHEPWLDDVDACASLLSAFRGT